VFVAWLRQKFLSTL